MKPHGQRVCEFFFGTGPYQAQGAPSTRSVLSLGASLLAILPLAAGCAGGLIRGQNEDAPAAQRGPQLKTVGNFAIPFGLQRLEVEAVGLVTNLPGTGSDPVPGALREELISEMQKRNVPNPNQVLASRSTALVLVRGYIKPGAQEGDTFDLEVRTPSNSETTSLRGGYLLPVSLREMKILGGAVRKGSIMAVGRGSIMIDPAAEEGDNPIASTRGRALGGGIVAKTQPLALVLKPESKSTFRSRMVGDAINRRFSFHQNTIRDGVATPKTDEYIELAVHPRYRYNIERYLKVIRSVPIRETPAERIKRLENLKSQLLDPISSQQAALHLEALGKAGADHLKAGLASPSPEVRFYAAESLAYLGDRDAVEPLRSIAVDEPAFRVYALTALATMDEVLHAYGALKDLLHVPSAETRYGAFRALWMMDRTDPFVRGELLAGQFTYHVIESDAPPMVHVTRSFRPEIVVFGVDQHVKTPLLVEAGPRIWVQGLKNKVTVTKLAAFESEQQRVASTRIDEIIRAIVEVGGTYPDVVQALHAIDDQNALEGRFVIDALPEGGRNYTRPLRNPVDTDQKDLGDSSDLASDPVSAPVRARKESWWEGALETLNPVSYWRP